MVGPLFYQEMLLGSRRSREHAFRWVYGGWLILLVLWFTAETMIVPFAGPFAVGDPFNTTGLCQRFTGFFLVQHFILLFLATPAFVAGGVSDEKTRGTLQYLLTTDLTSVHLIVGKLLGRVAHVGVLALAGLPLFCCLGALGGAEPRLVLGTVLLTAEVLVGLAAATFLAAVWSRQTRDAVIGLYAVALLAFAAGALVAGPVRTLWPSRALDGVIELVGVPLRYFNPLYVLEPALTPGGAENTRDLFRRLLAALFAWGGLAVLCAGLAAWRLRPAYIKQLEGEGRRRKVTWWRGGRAPVDDEPVRWKERHVEGLAPLPSLRRIPRWLGIAVIAAATVGSSVLILWSHLSAGVTGPAALRMALRLEFVALAGALLPSDDAFLAQGVIAMLFFSLLVGIRCSGAITGEREKQCWEALLLTPLTAHQLIRGKLWGITAVSYVYLLAYAVPALLLSALGGLMAWVWTALWLAVTMLAMYYIGAAGLWSSVRSKGSWRSLLSTLGFGYVGGFVIYACTTPVLLILALVINALLLLIDKLYLTTLTTTVGGTFARYQTGFGLATCLGLAVIFWVASRVFLNSAQRWVAERERTRHWQDEPVRRPRRRVARTRVASDVPRER